MLHLVTKFKKENIFKFLKLVYFTMNSEKKLKEEKINELKIEDRRLINNKLSVWIGIACNGLFFVFFVLNIIIKMWLNSFLMRVTIIFKKKFNIWQNFRRTYRERKNLKNLIFFSFYKICIKLNYESRFALAFFDSTVEYEIATINLSIN